MNLRDYQNESILAVHDAWRAGKRRVILCAPTGSGKRIVAVWWAARALGQGKRTLVVTDRRQLVFQMAEELRINDLDHGIVMGEVSPNQEADVQVASIQTLRSRHLADGHGLPEADLLIVDEAHKDSNGYAALFELMSHALTVGLTATPVGPSGTSLVPKLYDAIVETTKNSELIQRGFLLPTTCLAPSEPVLDKVPKTGGEWQQRALMARMIETTTWPDIWKAWEPHADKQTLVFVPGVDYARGLCNEFNERGHRAALIVAKTGRDEREDILARFGSRDLRVLVSVDVLKEGFDSPIAEVGIDLQPTLQLRTAWQKWGRLKRPFDGQDNATLIDLAGNIWRHPHPDEDPDWSLATADVSIDKVLRQRKADRVDPEPIMCGSCGTIRLKGPKCPACGAGAMAKTKRLRFGEGKVKEIPIKAKKKKQKDVAQRQWDSALFAGAASGWSLKRCQSYHNYKFGTWPPYGLRNMPSNGSVQWSRKVTDVYPWTRRKAKR